MHFSDSFMKRFLHFLPDAMLVLNGLIHWHIFNKVLVGRRQTDKVLLEALNLITFPKEVDNFIKFPAWCT